MKLKPDKSFHIFHNIWYAYVYRITFPDSRNDYIYVLPAMLPRHNICDSWNPLFNQLHGLLSTVAFTIYR